MGTRPIWPWRRKWPGWRTWTRCKADRDLLRSVGANSIKTQLEAADEISTAMVIEGAGTEDEPWIVQYTTGDAALDAAIGPVGTNVYVGARKEPKGRITQTLYLADVFQLEFGSDGRALDIPAANAATELEATVEAPMTLNQSR